MIGTVKNIKWKGISIFPEETGYLLVLLCENESQSAKLFSLMSENNFRFYVGGSYSNSMLLILHFIDKKVQCSLPMPDDKIFRHFDGGLINAVTTGFEVDANGITYNNGRLIITDQNYGRQN